MDPIQQVTPEQAPQVAPQPVADVGQVAQAAPAPVAITAPVAEVNPLIALLPEELRVNKNLATFKDIGELAKSYLHQQSLIGKRVSEMSPEDFAAYKNVMGVPQEKDSYSLPEYGDPEVVNWYKDVAFKAGLTQDQARVVMEQYAGLEKSKQEAYANESKQMVEQGITELKKEFGAAFNERIDVAKRAVQAFGGDELKGFLQETGLGNHPIVVKLFAKIGAELLEDSMLQSDAQQQLGVTPTDAKRMIDSKLADPEFRQAYYGATHHQHKAAVDEINKLFHFLNANG